MSMLYCEKSLGIVLLATFYIFKCVNLKRKKKLLLTVYYNWCDHLNLSRAKLYFVICSRFIAHNKPFSYKTYLYEV